MQEFTDALLFAALLAVLAQLVGPLLPRSWFCAEKFPFRPFFWENSGRIYNKLSIRRWKDHVPDMSRYTKRMMTKNLSSGSDLAHTERLIQETCVAESVHAVLMVLSLRMLHRHRTRLTFFLWATYNLLGNLPYIIIQRYNRPRLVKLAEKLRLKEQYI